LPPSISTALSPGVEEADVILLVGTNLRTEAPLINTRAAQGRASAGAKVFADRASSGKSHLQAASGWAMTFPCSAKLPSHVVRSAEGREQAR
jgi:NADH-quinone oxidoreductase subunit G